MAGGGDTKKYFAKFLSSYQKSEEERECANIIFNDGDVFMGDQRLNHIAALTYNAQQCNNIFAMLEKAISPTENPWKSIYKALLIVHTIILYGSELAVDKSIELCKYIHPLQTYNSALVKKGLFSFGGTDYGAPVRATATTVSNILMKDENIRKARADARKDNSLVPLGAQEEINPSKGVTMTYGQGINSSVGAGFSLEQVPGMYEGRPERYFDNANDIRNRTTQGNHQITRDAMAPSLLDLAFDSNTSTNANLPSADYLPALQKQQELEKQLKEQQELLRKLQEQSQQQEQMRLQQIQQLQMQQPSPQFSPQVPYGQTPPMGMGVGYGNVQYQASQNQMYNNAGINMAMAMGLNMPSNAMPMSGGSNPYTPPVPQQQQHAQYPGMPAPMPTSYPPQQQYGMMNPPTVNTQSQQTSMNAMNTRQQIMLESRTDSHEDYMQQFTGLYNQHNIDYLGMTTSTSGKHRSLSRPQSINLGSATVNAEPLPWSFPAPPQGGSGLDDLIQVGSSYPPSSFNNPNPSLPHQQSAPPRPIDNTNMPMGPPPPVPSFKPPADF